MGGLPEDDSCDCLATSTCVHAHLHSASPHIHTYVKENLLLLMSSDRLKHPYIPKWKYNYQTKCNDRLVLLLKGITSNYGLLCLVCLISLFWRFLCSYSCSTGTPSLTNPWLPHAQWCSMAATAAAVHRAGTMGKISSL